MRRHGDKVAGDFQIELLALLQIGKILVQDERDGDILYFDLVFREQVKDQVKRPLKVLQLLAAAFLHHALELEDGVIHVLPQKNKLNSAE